MVMVASDTRSGELQMHCPMRCGGGARPAGNNGRDDDGDKAQKKSRSFVNAFFFRVRKRRTTNVVDDVVGAAPGCVCHRDSHHFLLSPPRLQNQNPPSVPPDLSSAITSGVPRRAAMRPAGPPVSSYLLVGAILTIGLANVISALEQPAHQPKAVETEFRRLIETLRDETSHRLLRDTGIRRISPMASAAVISGEDILNNDDDPLVAPARLTPSASAAFRSRRSLRHHHRRRRKGCPAIGGKTHFLCPSRRDGYDVCINREQLCDAVHDCPKGEDEDPHHCMFYQPIDDQLKTLSHALLLLVDNVMGREQPRAEL
uniref:EGF-like domain-containing protein n=1 Tax=Panagrellus redivivus TaxID=6233 RepID=A0A7E4WCZ1_PANRE